MNGADNRPQLMKRNSRSLIMYCVSRHKKASRGQIIELTGLSRAHVCNVVDELIAEGELIETGNVSIGRGRPTVLLQINPNGASAAGVWIAEGSIEVGVGGPTGDVLSRTSLYYSGDAVADVDAIADAIECCAKQAGKSMGAMRGVGVAVSGSVHPDPGVISFMTRPDTGFAGIPIVKMLQERTGLPVYADADIRAAALADQWYKVESERVVYIAFADGIGTAFVNGRELFGNENGEAPAVTHTVLDRNGPLCVCGKRGCAQAYTTIFSFIRSLWPELDPAQMTPRERGEWVKKGVDLAAQGDSDAVAAVSKLAEDIGFVIAIVINMLDPQVVYVAGTLMDSIPDMMIRIIRREAMSYLHRLFMGVEIKPLTRMSEFELKGAFGLVLFHQFRTLNNDITTRMLTPSF